jgi:phosphatidylglycerol lysyltransferase
VADPDALRLLRLHGWNLTSFQTLEPSFRHWYPDRDAFVAYADTGTAWVAAGPPICAPDRLEEVTAGFVDAARARHRRACLFGVGDRFTRRTTMDTLHVGEQPLWDPRRWTENLASSRSLREQLRRARARQVTVTRLTPATLDAHRLAALDELIAAWLRSRRMAPMGFLVEVLPFHVADERLLFVAEVDGAPVGLLSAVPAYARNGWLFEDLIRHPDAPNGVTQLLVHAGMTEVAARGAEIVSLGMAPLAGEVAPSLRWIRRMGAPLYDFAGVHAYKRRLHPHAWEPVHLAVPVGHSRWLALIEALRAFAGGSFLRFGLHTLGRRRPPLRG